MYILEIIKSRRKELGITQSEMAKKLHMARTTYQGIENNVINLKIYDFFQIIKILNIPFTTFMDENYIVISEKDFINLKKASETISKITDRVESNVNISNSNIENININSKREF